MYVCVYLKPRPACMYICKYVQYEPGGVELCFQHDHANLSCDVVGQFRGWQREVNRATPHSQFG